MHIENLHINDELESISPILAKIQKSNVQESPQGYFETVEEQILSQLSLSMAKVSSKLDVPEGYFDSIEDKIIERFNYDQKKPKTIFRYIVHHNIIKIAAMVIFVLGIAILFQTNLKEDKADTLFTIELSESEMWDYIIQDSEDISLMALIENGLIEEEDLIVLTE